MQYTRKWKRFLVINFYYLILRRDMRISTFLIDLLLKMLAVIVVSIDRFLKNSSMLSASALTFYSTLAFIPVMALILAIARGFGGAVMLEEWLKDQSYANPEVMEWVMKFAVKALDNTQSGLITGLGVLVLLWSVIRMLASTELAMNQIWEIRNGRGLVKKFTDYMAILFIVPILVMLISSLNVFMMSNLQAYAAGEGFLSYASAALTTALRMMPYVLVWFLFTFLYMFMPSTHVKFKHAFIAGVVAGTIFQIIQWFYLKFQVGVSSYNTIYGGLAALPLLLVWLQLSWSIVLWGTELCYIMRNRHFMYKDAIDGDNQWVDNVDISILILKFISNEYINNNGGPTQAMIYKGLKMNSTKIKYVLQELVDKKILIDVKNDDETSYFPAIDFHTLALSDIITCLSKVDKSRSKEWNIRFTKAIKGEFSKDTFA